MISPGQKERFLVRSQGLGIAGRKPSEGDPFRNQGGREPREWWSALVGIFLHAREKSTQSVGVSLRRDVGDGIGDLGGLSVGVGSACSRHSRVSRAIWKMMAGGAATEEVTDKNRPPL